MGGGERGEARGASDRDRRSAGRRLVVLSDAPELLFRLEPLPQRRPVRRWGPARGRHSPERVSKR
jgi:hypothetical protein